MFPYIFFPNWLLPRQLYFILNEGHGIGGAGTALVVLQVFLLLYTSVRSVYSLVKRDNHAETFALLMVPLGALFIICLMETILLSGFLGSEFNPKSTIRLLSSPGYCVQIVVLSAVFVVLAALYEWLNRRLNGHKEHPLVLFVLYGLETLAVLMSLYVGVQGANGGTQWLKNASPALLQWYIYGLNLLFTKAFVYAAAILFGLLFANRSARARLRHRTAHDMEPEADQPMGQDFFGSEYRDFAARGAEPDLLEAQRRVKQYIRAKSFPYFFGLGFFGFGFSAVLLGLQYFQYREGVFYQPGDLPGMAVFSAILIAFICVMGWLENMVNVFAPGCSRNYRRLRDAEPAGLAMERFHHEFFEKPPLFAVGSLNNVIITEHFVVLQGYRLKIIPIASVVEICRRVPAGSPPLSAQSLITLTLKNGKKERLTVPPAKDPMGKIYWHLVDCVAALHP